jgi:hypothetical protein
VPGEQVGGDELHVASVTRSRAIASIFGAASTAVTDRDRVASSGVHRPLPQASSSTSPPIGSGAIRSSQSAWPA